MFPELIILFLTFLTFLIILNHQRARKFKKLDAVDGPPGVFLFGNALYISSRGNHALIQMLEEWIETYGRRYKFLLGTQPYVTISSAEDAEKIFTSTVNIQKSPDYDLMLPWLGTGLLTSRDQKWHQRRKLLTPAFHFKILEDFLPIMNEQSKVMVKVLSGLENKEFDVFPYITRAALDIICETAMGRKINAQLQTDSDYVKALYRISEIIQYRQFRPWLHPQWIWNLSSTGKEEAHCLKILHSLTEKVIKEKKEERKNSANKNVAELDEDAVLLGGKKRLAFLDLLLDAQEKDPRALPDVDIREETDTFMFEGHDTTAASVNWTTFLLGHHPEIQEKVYQELEDVLGSDKSKNITTEDLSKLKYLEMCIKEGLRIYPSVPFIGRTITSELVLDSKTTIPRDTTLMIFPFFIHRDEKYYPDPEKFIPERFLPENSVGRHAYAYVPFSAGSRNCIGQKFALMEEKVMLANIFRNYRVKSMERRDDVCLLAELILRPRDGLRIRIEKRV